MTRERRQDVVIVALVLSVALHVGFMFYVRSQVMTTIAGGVTRAERPDAMRVRRAVDEVETAKIEELLDLKAVKSEPEAERIDLPETPVEVATPEVDRVAPLALAEDIVVPEVERATFSAKVADEIGEKPSPMPVMAIDTPLALMTASSVVPLSERAVARPQPKSLPVPAAAGVPDAPAVAELPARRIVKERDPQRGRQTAAFKPSETVYEKVDEKIVSEEKAAVKLLVDQDKAEELVKFVDSAIVRETVGEWCYFKVMFSPRPNLTTVSKDLVVIIDASGSVGRERMGSIRKSAKKVLRTATNTGDRFNLVAFRDRFTYAFTTWQNCDRDSFEQSDDWLDNLAAHGRTDVFGTISSVLTLPRNPSRPLIALVITDGDANAGVSDTASILSRFTALNGGLISVYMYGIKSTGNRELIDTLTRGNRGESLIFDGWRWNAGEGIEPLSELFRDPVLSDIAVIFAAGCPAEAYPRNLRNLYRSGTLSFCGRVPAGTREVAFSLRGLNGATAYEGFFRLPLDRAAARDGIAAEWQRERAIDLKLK